jgi:7-cyano-7-deazaguanine synthase
MAKIALLSLSGGLDSTSLLLHILAQKTYDKVYTYSFKYGQNHSIELKKAQKLVKQLNKLLPTLPNPIEHQIIDLSSIFKDCGSSLTSGSNLIPKGQDYNETNQQSTVIPIRNVIFASILYSKASGLITTFLNGNHHDISVDIFTGVHSNDNAVYPDCRPESVQMAQQLFKLSDYNGESINYKTPFVNFSKSEVLNDGITSLENLGLSKQFKQIYKNTITCYAPNEKGESCGECASCKDRLEAFEYNGMVDPIKYENRLQKNS